PSPAARLFCASVMSHQGYRNPGIALLCGERSPVVSKKSSVPQNVLSLPKGGGAIKGIGETFQPHLFSGTGHHTIPLAISPGRDGFGPKLSLEYSSGNGNGLFGLGWQLSLPRITRKTEKGLPCYDDRDVFVLSGAEDLVPCLQKIVDPTSGQETWVP